MFKMEVPIRNEGSECISSCVRNQFFIFKDILLILLSS